MDGKQLDVLFALDAGVVIIGIFIYSMTSDVALIITVWLLAINLVALHLAGMPTKEAWKEVFRI